MGVQHAGLCGTQRLGKVTFSSQCTAMINVRLNFSLICSWVIWIFNLFFLFVFLFVYLKVVMACSTLFFCVFLKVFLSLMGHFCRRMMNVERSLLWPHTFILQCYYEFIVWCWSVSRCVLTQWLALSPQTPMGGGGLNPVMLEACLVLSECPCKPTFQKELRDFKVSPLTRGARWPHCNCSKRTLGCHSAVP